MVGHQRKSPSGCPYGRSKYLSSQGIPSGVQHRGPSPGPPCGAQKSYPKGTPMVFPEIVHKEVPKVVRLVLSPVAVPKAISPRLVPQEGHPGGPLTEVTKRCLRRGLPMMVRKAVLQIRHKSVPQVPQAASTNWCRTPEIHQGRHQNGVPQGWS